MRAVIVPVRPAYTGNHVHDVTGLLPDGDDEFTGHDKQAPTLVAAVFDENVAFTHVSSIPPRYLFLSGPTLPLEEVFLFVCTPPQELVCACCWTGSPKK